mmetsp:Transcript_33504/g.83674  ORF Transcript_33504/g.83674 Transcript_33504/m.83674 type:complete len:211 (-) Transcript_33504:119-751(-)
MRISSSCSLYTPFLTAASHAPWRIGPSRKSAIGRTERKAMAVTMANVLPASMFSPLGWLELFLVITPRSEKAKFEPIAYAKQSHVKLSSAAEAMATPITTGRRHEFTCHGSMSPMRMAPNTTLKNGSSDLTTLTKASEPAPSDRTVTHWPRPWMRAMGAIVMTLEVVRLGAFFKPVSQRGPTYRRPRPSCRHAIVHGRSSTLRTVLFMSL